MEKSEHIPEIVSERASARQHTESNVLTFIKYAPAAFIILVCGLFATSAYYELHDIVEREVAQTTQDYITTNREIIKTQAEHAVERLEMDYRNLRSELRSLAKQDVFFAFSLIQSVEKEFPNSPSEEVTREVLEALERARLRSENGYYIIFTTDAKGVLNRNYPNYPGMDLSRVKDGRGRLIVADILDHLKTHPDMDVEWYWHRPNHPELSGRKVGYCGVYKPRRWVICTGSYLDEYVPHAKEHALKMLERVRYGESGYLYAIDYQDVVRAHVRADLVGKNYFDLTRDEARRAKWREARVLAKNGGGYITVPGVPKMNGQMTSTKVQYVLAFPAWELIIGTGYYVDDVAKVLAPRIAFLNQRYDTYMLKIWVIGGSIAFVALVFSLLLSRRMERLFTEHRDELEKLSTMDKLTKLNNRLKLDDVLEYEFRKFQRYGEPLSIILLDVDYFKRINDTHGHQVGDKVLVAVASILNTCRRETDIVGRWGGEEFLVVCPHTTVSEAVIVAERYRNTIAEHEFTEIGPLTASFGVTQVSPRDAIAHAVKRADDALYVAKRDGRNLVKRLD